jgi:hypothetical protein
MAYKKPPNDRVDAGGADSIKHRRINYDAKHAPAARVQRFVRQRLYQKPFSGGSRFPCPRRLAIAGSACAMSK